MEIVLGLLLLLALCGSRAASKGLAVLVLAPLTFLALLVLLSTAGQLWTFAFAPTKPGPVQMHHQERSAAEFALDEEYHAGVTLAAMRARYHKLALP